MLPLCVSCSPAAAALKRMLCTSSCGDASPAPVVGVLILQNTLVMTHTHVGAPVDTHACMHAHTHTHAHARTHTHTHTHTHSCIRTSYCTYAPDARFNGWSIACVEHITIVTLLITHTAYTIHVVTASSAGWGLPTDTRCIALHIRKCSHWQTRTRCSITFCTVLRECANGCVWDTWTLCVWGK